MLRRFFIWRATRKLGRSRYRLDRRTYPGPFKSGFLAHLSATRFWQGADDRYQLQRRRRRRLVVVFLILGGLGMAWLIVESARAVRLF